MSKTAFLFPGQGSQYAGMGKSLFSNFPAVRRVFEEADHALAFPISKLCFEGPEEGLKLTHNTQPALLTVSAAAMQVLRENRIEPDFVAGHSLGEYSALVAAGSLGLADAVRLVRQRGMYMQEAVPVGVGAMAALLKLPEGKLDEVLRQAALGDVVSTANLNSPDQVVIAGHAVAVARAVELAKAAGARRAVLLPVSAPFHCALMRPAQERLAPELRAATTRDPRVPVIANVDAAPRTTAAGAIDALVAQVSSPVRWEDSVNRLVAEGVTTFVEVGPGTVLSGLVKKIARDAAVFSVQVPEDLAALDSALALPS